MMQRYTENSPAPDRLPYFCSVLLELDLISYQSQLRIRHTTEGRFVFDPVRRKEVVLTPEELLRQLVIAYLLEARQYPLGRMRSEVGIVVNGMPRRCDIIVYDQAFQPWLLIECKSPKVALEQHVFEQVSRYNIELKAPYLAITNGLSTYCCAIDFGEGAFQYLPALPEYPSPVKTATPQ